MRNPSGVSGFGEYQFPDEHDLTESTARSHFLRALREACYEVLEDLYDSVLGVSEREGALEAWSRRWNLDVPWVLDAARSTVEAWEDWDSSLNRRASANRNLRYWAGTDEPALLPELHWTVVPGELRWPDKGPPQFSYRPQPFNPFQERASEYRRRVESRFQKALRDHVAEAKSWAEEQGGERVAAPQRGAKSDRWERFRWLARHVAGGETHEEIARTAGVTLQNVQKHCAKLADLAGLNLSE